MILSNEDIKQIYDSHFIELVPKIEGAYYRYNQFGETESPFLGGLSYENARNYFRFISKSIKNYELYLKTLQFLKNMRTKKSRLKKKIDLIMQEHSYFLTLTFTDSVLNNTNKETRKTYVKEFLKKNSNYYVANEDYGFKNDREHYHAILRAPAGTFLFKNDKSWSYGYIKAQVINNQIEDKERLAKYITKLANHSLKETNKAHCVIYSRIPKKTI